MTWNWDHLRFFLALADDGTLSIAAKRLEVSHTTVLRRIRAFEKELQTQLFDHAQGGYTLTNSGRSLYTEAVKMQSAITGISRNIFGADAEIRGEVVITTTDTIAFAILPDLLAELQLQHESLRFTLDMLNGISDIDRREADIAIRACREPPDRLIGRHIGTIQFVACASNAYLSKNETKCFPVPSHAHRFITLDQRYAGSPFHSWFEDRLDANANCTKVSGFISAVALCRAGMGITVLPVYMLKAFPDLVALPTDELIPTNDLWILSHPDLRDTQRVRLVKQHLYERLSSYLAE